MTYDYYMKVSKGCSVLHAVSINTPLPMYLDVPSITMGYKVTYER